MSGQENVAKKRVGALLYSACPMCVDGDLTIWRHRGEFVAGCFRCGHLGSLQSVYAPPEAAAGRPPPGRPKTPAGTSA